MEGTYVFIDGAYLSLISKHFGNGKYLDFDINRFAITLSRSQGLWCKGVYYYTAPPYQSPNPTDAEIRKKAGYDRFISKLKNIQNFTVREGRCQKVDDGYHQKGVDTLFTMDLFTLCHGRDIKTIVVLTCDTDFVPVLNRLRSMGIEIILFYFSDYKRKSKFSMSNHILTACDKKVLVQIEHFEKSMKTGN